MKRYAGDAQASELGKFDSTVRRMSDEDKARYRSPSSSSLRAEIDAFEAEQRKRKEAAKKPPQRKEEPIRFAGWADPRKSAK